MNISHKGFTLIELLLYISLTGIIILSVSIFTINILQSRVKNQTTTEVEQQGAQIMQNITQAIRNAESINSPTMGNSGSSLSLHVTSSIDDPTVFNISSNILQIKKGTGQEESLHNSRVSFSNLTFSNLTRTGTPGIIRIQFTLSYVNNSGRNEYEYSKNFYASASLR